MQLYKFFTKSCHFHYCLHRSTSVEAEKIVIWFWTKLYLCSRTRKNGSTMFVMSHRRSTLHSSLQKLLNLASYCKRLEIKITFVQLNFLSFLKSSLLGFMKSTFLSRLSFCRSLLVSSPQTCQQTALRIPGSCRTIVDPKASCRRKRPRRVR